jgi:hypothetical protein
MDCSCAACSSRNLHRSLTCDGQTRTACGLKSPFTMGFVLADRDRGTGSVTVVVRLTMVVVVVGGGVLTTSSLVQALQVAAI